MALVTISKNDSVVKEFKQNVIFTRSTIKGYANLLKMLQKDVNNALTDLINKESGQCEGAVEGKSMNVETGETDDVDEDSDDNDEDEVLDDSDSASELDDNNENIKSSSGDDVDEDEEVNVEEDDNDGSCTDLQKRKSENSVKSPLKKAKHQP